MLSLNDCLLEMEDVSENKRLEFWGLEVWSEEQGVEFQRELAPYMDMIGKMGLDDGQKEMVWMRFWCIVRWSSKRYVGMRGHFEDIGGKLGLPWGFGPDSQSRYAEIIREDMGFPKASVPFGSRYRAFSGRECL